MQGEGRGGARRRGDREVVLLPQTDRTRKRAPRAHAALARPAALLRQRGRRFVRSVHWASWRALGDRLGAWRAPARAHLGRTARRRESEPSARLLPRAFPRARAARRPGPRRRKRSSPRTCLLARRERATGKQGARACMYVCRRPLCSYLSSMCRHSRCVVASRRRACQRGGQRATARRSPADHRLSHNRVRSAFLARHYCTYRTGTEDRMSCLETDQ